jgi:hypothetical protein
MQSEASGTVVIVAYRPKPGKEAALLALTREHVPLLRADGLATDRPPTACLAQDGTVIELFEWVAGGMERAHANPAVAKLWERYAEVCDYVPLASLRETSSLFAAFAPVYL